MFRMNGAILVVAAGLLTGVSASPDAAFAGDARDGRMTFERWCTSCHAVKGSASARDVAPPLTAIVAKKSLTPPALRHWLANPHPPMPNFNLGHIKIENLIAYFESLRRN